ncbi:unnamed protein product [Paramecium sonneborni]|uniref:Uncharacterized protein n=1 Tax=Paramecium sonneborni TaxID=65129 RepID=A0A8S1N3Z6_9CILI|nr:unnamed protein product [Paramecium sonneborni]
MKLSNIKIKYIFQLDKFLQKHRLGETQLKSIVNSTSQKMLKTTQKDFQETNQIKDGDIYEKISPKVIFKDDKINVYFVKEIKKFTQQNETRTQTQEQGVRKQTIQEVTNSRVSIKGPIGGEQNQIQPEFLRVF